MAQDQLMVSTIVQKFEKNKIEDGHDKRQDSLTTVYHTTDTKQLIAVTSSLYSHGDTSMIFVGYFHDDQVVKVKLIIFERDNVKSEFHYYFDNDRLINTENETRGIHKSRFYINWAKDEQKSYYSNFDPARKK